MHDEPLGVKIQVFMAVCSDSDQLRLSLLCIFDFQGNVTGKRTFTEIVKSRVTVIPVFPVEITPERAVGILVCRLVKEISARLSQKNQLKRIDDRGFSGCRFFRSEN
jgi:hypothetical protein